MVSLERSSSQSLLPQDSSAKVSPASPGDRWCHQEARQTVGTGIGEEDLQHHGFQAIILTQNRPR